MVYRRSHLEGVEGRAGRRKRVFARQGYLPWKTPFGMAPIHSICHSMGTFCWRCEGVCSTRPQNVHLQGLNVVTVEDADVDQDTI
jgi:hypothetical protein